MKLKHDVNYGYFDSNRRSAYLQSLRDSGVAEDTIISIRSGMNRTLNEIDKYLYHIYYLRDEAATAISEGRLEDAKSLLERIGK